MAKYCKCEKWVEDSRYDHNDGNEGKAPYKNTFSFCPWCKKKLKWRELL